MAISKSLGNIVVFPLELRRVIWGNLPIEELANVYHGGILQEEVRALVEEMKLEFTISGAPSGPYGSEIKVRDQHKSYGSLYPTWLSFDTHDPTSGRLDYFLRVPYNRIRSTTIRLTMGGDKPGILLSCWNSLVWMVELWHRAQHSRGCHLNIELEASPIALHCWAYNGACFRTLKRVYDWGKQSSIIDILTLIKPLRRLRDTTLSIRLPSSLPVDRNPAMHKVARSVEALTKSDVPFGQHEATRINEDDEDIADRIKAHSAWFDFILDELTDQSASILRLERFASWGPGYHANFKHNARWFADYAERFNVEDTDEFDAVFAIRKRTLVAFSPGNWRRQKGKLRLHGGIHPLGPDGIPFYNLMLQHDDRDCCGIAPATWFEAYGECGIPPASSDECIAALNAYDPLDKDIPGWTGPARRRAIAEADHGPCKFVCGGDLRPDQEARKKIRCKIKRRKVEVTNS